MDLALSIFGVAFAAFCVWLGVRLFNRRQRWAIWTAVVVGLPALYVMSIGPACWLFWAGNTPEVMRRPLDLFYGPLNYSPGPMRDAIDRYIDLWVDR